MSERTVQVTARAGTTRCAYCHGPLADADGTTCPSCATRLHTDCVEARCPTLGCPHEFARVGAPTAERADPTPEWPGPPYFFAVFLPFACFIANEAGFPRGSGKVVPNWRGEPLSWFGQLRAAEVQRFFYPLLLWSMIAYVAACHGARAPWIRVGLRGGVVVAALFSLTYLTLIPASVLGLVVFGLGFLGLAPHFALWVYAKAALRYARERRVGPGEDTASGYVPWTVWSVLTGAATTLAIQRMNARWAVLPTDDPNCFVATAAARGHARVVGSTPVRFANGRVVPVTRQLRALKAAELALAAFTPRLHRALRAVYDRVGPPLAARLGRTTGAVAWILLLPAQALAEVGLRVVFRDAGRLIARTYERQP